jgi:DNA-binding transcriptional LysR family regulator
MQALRKLIHSPHHLFVFEVCGRLLSFTLAARELGVSQPAVSLAIRQMEQACGLALFERRHRGIELTAAGAQLYTEVSDGMGRILRTLNELNKAASPRLVTLSVSTAFANYWVMPRLSGLHQRHPQIDLRLQVVDKDVNLEDENVTLGIRRGRAGQWPGYQSACIAAEELLPVASQSYIEDNGLPGSVQALLGHQFIHLEEPFRPRPEWKDWFRAMDVDYTDQGEGLRLNDYALVIQAAMSGEGVALGWRHIVDPLIERRLLLPLCERSWTTGEEFHLIWSQRIELSPAAQQVRAWLLGEVGAPLASAVT